MRVAEATTSIVREASSENHARAHIEQSLDENAEGIVQALGLLQDLEERGVLPLLRALVEQGDDVLKVLLALVTREEYLGGIKNLIAIAQLLTAIPPSAMESMVHGVKHGVHEAANNEPKSDLGVYDLVKQLRDPDVSRAISFAMSFLKGMGSQLGEQHHEGGGEA